MLALLGLWRSNLAQSFRDIGDKVKIILTNASSVCRTDACLAHSPTILSQVAQEIGVCFGEGLHVVSYCLVTYQFGRYISGETALTGLFLP